MFNGVFYHQNVLEPTIKAFGIGNNFGQMIFSP